MGSDPDVIDVLLFSGPSWRPGARVCTSPCLVYPGSRVFFGYLDLDSGLGCPRPLVNLGLTWLQQRESRP